MSGNTGNKKVFVAMSGGVDSSVAAALLKERGFDSVRGQIPLESADLRSANQTSNGVDVVGVHIKMWSDPSIPCNFKEDRYDALRAAEKIGIPFQTWDFTEEYRKAVVEYMIREYAAGRTPNPDVMCNRHVKFGVFLKRALESGADFVATGHYIGLRNTKKMRDDYSYIRKEFVFRSLLQAKDKNKDQSYFLWTLTQDQLRHCLFPIGEYTKPEVRQMARKFGLPTAEKKDSQGICFIGEIDLVAFLKKHIPAARGPVLTTSGREVGGHAGLAFYTIGQREGLGIGGGIPYYVTEKDFSRNTLVVAEGPYDDRLFSREVAVTDVNWISGKQSRLPLKCEARIRYRQPLQRCIVEPKAESPKLKAASLKVTFNDAQRAVTPGQSIVFYQGEEMLGGGVITDTSAAE